jgi:hypothetical protein
MKYDGSINKNWKILNELANPEYQPSIMVYFQEHKQEILVWSKEYSHGISHDDMYEWINLFIYITINIQKELIKLPETPNNINKDLKKSELIPKNSYEFLVNLL